MTAASIPFRPRLRPAVLLVASLGVVVASQLSAVIRPPQALPPHPAPAAAPVVDSPGGPVGSVTSDLAQIDHSIRVWTANLAANDKDFLSATNLGQLYDARARLTGDIADYSRALEALNRALAIEPSLLAARLLHARELLATHDFGGALAEARAIDGQSPGQPQVLAVIGDASLELGDVDGAAASYRQAQVLAPGAPLTARLARVAFLRGDVAGALTLAAQAVDESAAAGDAGVSASWYAYLCGTLALAAGDADGALDWFERALEQWPQSYLALAGRARALAGAGRTVDAIAAYQAAIAIAPQPDVLAALGDLYALSGDQRAADEQFATIELIARLAALNKQVYNRQLALFWLNHDRNAADALTLATDELALRKDIYGWDTYAWALLANDRPAEADAAEQHALALGTHDALIYYHAGVIAAAAGDGNRARSLLDSALALPGALDPLAAGKAQAALAAIR
jgi:tetratricopeptide (TPR) repeat protein